MLPPKIYKPTWWQIPTSPGVSLALGHSISNRDAQVGQRAPQRTARIPVVQGCASCERANTRGQEIAIGKWWFITSSPQSPQRRRTRTGKPHITQCTPSSHVTQSNSGLISCNKKACTIASMFFISDQEDENAVSTRRTVTFAFQFCAAPMYRLCEQRNARSPSPPPPPPLPHPPSSLLPLLSPPPLPTITTTTAITTSVGYHAEPRTRTWPSRPTRPPRPPPCTTQSRCTSGCRTPQHTPTATSCRQKRCYHGQYRVGQRVQ